MLIEKLQEERERLESALCAAKRDVEDAPVGSLRITHGTGAPEFYQRQSSSDRRGTYIPKAQIQTAKALAQKSYAERFKKAITPKIDLINEILNEYKANPLEAVYAELNPVRQQLIKPYLLSDEELIRQWMAIPFEPNPKHADSRTNITANGELVRSKSEVIIADNLKMLGIPYKYEAPITLNIGRDVSRNITGDRIPADQNRIPADQNSITTDQNRITTNKNRIAADESRTITIYPDFTCLNVKRRKLVFIEHFGMLDSEEYRNREFFWKIKHYESAGLIQGKNLLMTFEDENNAFNFADYKLAIEEFLLK